MTDITTLELSHDDSQAVELYEIVDGPIKYRYCTGPEDLLIDGVNWLSETIKRDSYERTDNLLKSGVSLKISMESQFCIGFLSEVPERVILVNIYSADRALDQRVLKFTGRILEYEAEVTHLTFKLEPFPTTIRRVGFAVNYQRLCRHRLYSGGCGVNSGLHNLVTTVAGNTGNIITINGNTKPDGYFSAGYIYSNGVFRMVSSHTGNSLRLVRPVPVIKPGDAITVYAGCDLTASTCKKKFNNIVHYGGFDFIPTKNPFGGALIY